MKIVLGKTSTEKQKCVVSGVKLNIFAQKRDLGKLQDTTQIKFNQNPKFRKFKNIHVGTRRKEKERRKRKRKEQTQKEIEIDGRLMFDLLRI